MVQLDEAFHGPVQPRVDEQALETLLRTAREDPEVSRYGVVIETDAGTIDAQLETVGAWKRMVLG